MSRRAQAAGAVGRARGRDRHRDGAASTATARDVRDGAAGSAAARAQSDSNATARGTVGWAVTRYVESRTDLSVKSQEQYAWAAGHIAAGIGAIRLDRLDRADIAAGSRSSRPRGEFAKRSLAIFRNVLRHGAQRRRRRGPHAAQPGHRITLPREVAKPERVKEAEAGPTRRSPDSCGRRRRHRLAVGFRLAVLYGLRRSELLALRWDDIDVEGGEVRIDEGLVPTWHGHDWTDAKNARSRRTIPIDAATARASHATARTK